MSDEMPKPRVLLVDEERRTLRLIQAFLMHDYEVIASQSPTEALALLEREGFHAVVASHAMQAVDVFEFVRHARELQPQLRCLLVSDTARPGDAEVARHSLACISFPFHPASLLELMEHLQ